MFEIFDAMRNKVTDEITERALDYLHSEFGLSFKRYIFTANDMTRVPVMSVDVSRLAMVTEVHLCRNQIHGVCLVETLTRLPNL